MKKLFTILILFAFCGNVVFAVSPTNPPGGRKGVHKSRHYKKARSSNRRRIPKPAPAATLIPNATIAPMLATEPQAIPEIVEDTSLLSGNSVVSINTNSNAIIKIGLSPHGIALIDFPANDPIYEIHPADENYVTIGCRRREQNTDQNKIGRCLDNPNDGIILRPGTAFNEWSNGVDASTIVTIQRVSGLVVPIIVVPVKKINQNANYVAIRYDVSKVIEARQTAGFSFNLNNQGQFNAQQLPSELNLKTVNGKNLPAANINVNNSDEQNPVEPESLIVSPDLLAALRRAGMTKPVLKFGKPVHGIALAIASRSNRLTENSIEVIAVKNTLNTPIRLTPEQPNLVVETIGEKNKGSVLSKDVAVLEIASNASDEDILNPGEVYYFAFSYKTPILGAKQSLWASFAHRAASDEPATILLGDVIK